MDDDLLLQSIDLLLDDDSALIHPNELFGIPESPVSCGSMPSSKPTKSFPKPAKLKRSRRLELQLLRDEVAQLEAIRDVLAKRSQKTSNQLNQSLTTSGDALAWKQTANEQLELFERAMYENLQYRKDLAAVFELGKKLRRQLKHQELMLREEMRAEEHHGAHTSRSADFHGSPIYNQLMSVIPKMYQQTNTVIEDLRQQLHLTTAHIRDIHLSERKDALDIVDARVVPFDHLETANAVWEWMCGDRSNFRKANVQRDFEYDGTMQMAFAGEIWIGNQWLRCRGDLVMRRFEERDRVVFVTSARVDAHGLDFIAGTKIIKHNQWIVISKNPTASCSEIVCRDVSRLANGQVALNFVQAGVQEHQDLMHVYVDSKLIDASRGGHGHRVDGYP